MAVPPVDSSEAAYTENQPAADVPASVEPGSGIRYWPLRTRSVGVLVAGFVVLTAISTGVGFLVVDVLADTFLGDRETAVATWFESHRTPRLDTLSEYASLLSDTFMKLIAVPILGTIFVIVWRRWHDAVFLAAALLVEVSAYATAKRLVGRDRPPVERLEDGLPTGSFPSGHVAAAVAFYVGLLVIARWHTRRRAVLVPVALLATLAPLAVAISRLYRGMHYLSDVLAGAALGAASLAVTYLALRVGVAYLRNLSPAPPLEATRLDVTEGERS